MNDKGTSSQVAESKGSRRHSRGYLPRDHSFRKLRSLYQIWPFDPDAYWWTYGPDEPHPEPVKLIGANAELRDPKLELSLRDARIASFEVSAVRILIHCEDPDVDRDGVLDYSMSLDFAGVRAWAVWQIKPRGHLRRLRHSAEANLQPPLRIYRVRILEWTDEDVQIILQLTDWPRRDDVVVAIDASSLHF